MSDQRVDFLVESVLSICQISERDRLSNKLLKSRDVTEFLDDPRYFTLPNYYHIFLILKCMLLLSFSLLGACAWKLQSLGAVTSKLHPSWAFHLQVQNLKSWRLMYCLWNVAMNLFHLKIWANPLMFILCKDLRWPGYLTLWEEFGVPHSLKTVQSPISFLRE